MTVNVWPHDNLDARQEQAPVALVSLNPDGSVTLHPEIVRQFAPDLAMDGSLTSVESDGKGPSNVSVLQPHNNETTNSQEVEANKGETPDWLIQQQAENTQKFARLGRLFSRTFRKAEKNFSTRYAAEKYVAGTFDVPVEYFRCLIRSHNQKRDSRIYKSQQIKIWDYHCDGLTNRQISEILDLHEKTIAKRVREILKQQKGKLKNVSK